MPRVECPGLPQKLLNYMAAGKAIVSFAGSAKLLEHEVTGLIVPNRDIAAFAKAIVRLSDDPTLSRRSRDGGARSHSRYGELGQGGRAVRGGLFACPGRTAAGCRRAETDTGGLCRIPPATCDGKSRSRQCRDLRRQAAALQVGANLVEIDRVHHHDDIRPEFDAARPDQRSRAREPAWNLPCLWGLMSTTAAISSPQAQGVR